MDIVFCSDRRVLAGLHVAAKSVLAHLAGTVVRPVFWIFSDEIDEADLALLHATLESTGRPFTLQLRSVDAAPLQAFPRLTGSLAAYYRLLVPEQIDAERYLYLDVDTLCRADLSVLMGVPLDGCPAALCSEGPITGNADTLISKLLGERATGDYFNSGVMVVDVQKWRSMGLTAQCLEFLTNNKVTHWDQSAVNYVLHGRIASIKSHFNCYTNVRSNWPLLKRPHSGKNCLLHFVDYPKPWSRYGEWVHPFGRDWWSAYRSTAHYPVGRSPDLEVELRWEQWPDYKKAVKDKLLFFAYARGWIQPKGVPSCEKSHEFQR
jgi:lipopolysaccharide biosynthesis glycosyltransferase